MTPIASKKIRRATRPRMRPPRLYPSVASTSEMMRIVKMAEYYTRACAWFDKRGMAGLKFRCGRCLHPESWVSGERIWAVNVLRDALHRGRSENPFHPSRVARLARVFVHQLTGLLPRKLRRPRPR